MFPKFIQVGLNGWGAYIPGMLNGLHIWGVYIQGHINGILRYDKKAISTTIMSTTT